VEYNLVERSQGILFLPLKGLKVNSRSKKLGSDQAGLGSIDNSIEGLKNRNW
jgi:hypothetical protein